MTIDFGQKLEDSFESVSFGALKHDVWWDRKEGFLDYNSLILTLCKKLAFFQTG